MLESARYCPRVHDERPSPESSLAFRVARQELSLDEAVRLVLKPGMEQPHKLQVRPRCPPHPAHSPAGATGPRPSHCRAAPVSPACPPPPPPPPAAGRRRRGSTGCCWCAASTMQRSAGRRWCWPSSRPPRRSASAPRPFRTATSSGSVARARWETTRASCARRASRTPTTRGTT